MHNPVTLFLTAFAALFSVVNPLGAMPMFLSMTAHDTPKMRDTVVFRSSIYFVIILVVSFLVGGYIINFFGISIDAMRIAGGFIILSSGLSLMGGDQAKSRSIDEKMQNEAIAKNDISLTPLAIPLLAGPGSISLLIGYSNHIQYWQGFLVIILVIIANGLASFAILRVAPRLVKYLGESGINSITRIMGFIVVSVGVQYIINGISSVVKGWHL